MINYYSIQNSADGKGGDSAVVIPLDSVITSTTSLSICNTSDLGITSVNIFYGEITEAYRSGNDWDLIPESLDSIYLIKNYPLSMGGLMRLWKSDLLYDPSKYELYVQTTTVGGSLSVVYTDEA
jgi:hypothetical protein